MTFIRGRVICNGCDIYTRPLPDPFLAYKILKLFDSQKDSQTVLKFQGSVRYITADINKLNALLDKTDLTFKGAGQNIIVIIF